MDLIHRRIELALMNEISDFMIYAEQWNKLGADFSAEGMACNAAICYSNFQRYAEQARALQTDKNTALRAVRLLHDAQSDERQDAIRLQLWNVDPVFCEQWKASKGDCLT